MKPSSLPTGCISPIVPLKYGHVVHHFGCNSIVFQLDVLDLYASKIQQVLYNQLGTNAWQIHSVLQSGVIIWIYYW